MKLAVAGTGYVGLVAGVCFAEKGHDVTCVDVDEKKIALLRAGVCPIYEQDLEGLMQKNAAASRLHYTTDCREAYRDAAAVFIGVGTPEQSDGSANLTHIAAAARQVAENIRRDCLVVVKSTVPVGTGDRVEQFIHDFLAANVKVEVANNPEFLAQGTAVHDTLAARRIIIGVQSRWAEDRLREIYAPFALPIVSVSRRSAEMIKYACNDFLALKISYMNDIANLCELVGADVEDVARGMAYDDRIGAKFLKAGVGYGGSCFPKDTKALRYLAGQYGYRLRTVEAAIDVNREQKLLLYKKAVRRLITFNHLRVAVLGLTFKPGTDDLREAPALENIPLLLEQGADICAYDPAGEAGCRARFPEIAYAASPKQALEGAHVCFIFTEWPEIQAVTPATYSRLMRTPLVYDGRNLYHPWEMAENGVEYYAIGRGTAQ